MSSGQDFSIYKYNASEISGKKHFCVCFDNSNLGEKTFYKFDLVDKHIGIKMLQTKQYGYEYNCESKTKLYFDIDLSVIETENKYEFMTEKYLLDFMEQLRNDINLLLNKDLLLNEFLVFIKKEQEIDCKMKTESIHIIIPSIIISKQHAKNIVEELNNKYSYKLDPKVYKLKGQAFCCYGSCKYGKTKIWSELQLSQTLFIYPFKKYTDFEESLIFTTNKVNTTFEPSKSSQDKTKTTLTEFSDIVLDDLNDVLFNRSSNWNYITYAFCVFFYEDIKQWLLYSSERSNGGYSYEQNLEFIKHFDKTKIAYNKKEMAKKLSYHSSKYEYVISEVKNCELYKYYTNQKKLQLTYGIRGGSQEQFSEKNEVSNTTGFLSHILGISKEFAEDETKYPIIVKEYNEKNRIYNYSHGFLCDEKKIPSMYCVLEKFKFANYYIDELLEKPIIPSNIIYKKFNTLEESTHLIDDLLCSDNDFTLFVEAPCGSGKSRTTTMKIITEYDYKSIIGITPNNSINIETTEKLNINQSKYTFKSHIEDKHSEYAFRITSLESLHHFANMDAELVILDEFTSIISQFESDTTGLKSAEEKYSKFQFFKQIIKNAKHVISLDAFIKEDHIELIKKIRKDINTEYIQSNNSIFADYTHNIYVNICKIKDKLFGSLNNNENLVINSDSKKQCDNWFGVISRQYDIMIMMMTKDGIIISKGTKKIIDFTKNNMDINNLTQSELDENIISMKKKLDYTIKTNNIQVFIYSPTITCGVSIELRDYFHNFFGFYSCKSVNTTTLLQGIWRIRSNKSREINMFFKECGYIKEEYSVLNYKKTFKKMIDKEDLICNYLKTNNINKETFLQNAEHNCPEYFKMRIMNQLRNTFDLKFMVSNIINTFKTYDMKFKVIYDYVVVAEISNPIEITEVDIFDSFEEFLNTPPITDENELCMIYYQYEFMGKDLMKLLDIKKYIKFKALVNYSTPYLHKINTENELFEIVKKKNKIKLLSKNQKYITDFIYIMKGVITYDEYKKSLYFNGTSTISTYDNYYVYKNIILDYDKIRRPYKNLLEIYNNSFEQLTNKHEISHHKIQRNEFGNMEYSYNYNNFDKTHENDIMYCTIKQIMMVLYNYDVNNPNQIKYDIRITDEIMDRFSKNKSVVENICKCDNIINNRTNTEIINEETKDPKNELERLTIKYNFFGPMTNILKKVNFNKNLIKNSIYIVNNNKFNLIQSPITTNQIQRIEYDDKLYYFKIYKTNYKHNNNTQFIYYAELIYINKIIIKKKMPILDEKTGKNTRKMVEIEYSYFIMNLKDNTKLGQGYKTITEMKDCLKTNPNYTNIYLNKIYDTITYTTESKLKYVFNNVLYEMKKQYNDTNFILKGKSFRLKEQIKSKQDVYNVDGFYKNDESLYFNNCIFNSTIIKHKTFKYIDVNIQVCNKYKDGLPIVLAYARGTDFIYDNYKVARLNPLDWSNVFEFYEDLTFIKNESEPSSIKPLKPNQKKITEWATYNVIQSESITIDNSVYDYYHIIIV